MTRGKALVAELRARPDVRDAEALAAWIGRHKRAGTLGMVARRNVKKALGSKGRQSSGDGLFSSRDQLPDPQKPAASPAKKPSILDDLHDEDFGGDDDRSAEDLAREKYEGRLTREAEKAERSRLYGVIQEAGGLKTRDDLREEYREIPNTFKRRDGLDGDEMAEYLATYYPEFGVEDERDLIDFLAS